MGRQERSWAWGTPPGSGPTGMGDMAGSWGHKPLVLLYLEEEIPHGVAVEIEEYREEEGLTSIGAVIYCEKKSHKGIIIGREGRKLKGIGKAARTEIEGLLGTKVFLRLWVKIKENWRDSDVAIANFGYKDQE